MSSKSRSVSSSKSASSRKSASASSTTNKKKCCWTTVCCCCIVLFIILVLFYLSKPKADGFYSASGVPNLKASSGECVVALFYADWCPHCVAFKPDFKKAMKELNTKTNKQGKTLRLEMVDCDANKDISKKYNVKGFPTVKIINDDASQTEYSGERSFESLQKYLISDN